MVSSQIRKIMELMMGIVPVIVGALLLTNTTLFAFLPVVVHIIVGWIIIAGGVYNLTKKFF